MSSGQFELKNGNLFVLAEAAGGVYNGSQLRLICDVVDDVSVFLKVTEDQRIGFMVPKDKLLELHAKLAKSGILLKHYRNHSILSPKACLGELCPKCEQDALGDAIEISPHLNEKFKESFIALNIGMNGCATACVASATDDIHVIGEKTGYKMLIGGRSAGDVKMAEFLVDSVPKEKIGESIRVVLETYSQNKQENESLADVVSRMGLEPFKQALQTVGLGQSSVAEASPSTDSNTLSDDDIAAVPLNEAALEEAAAPAEEAAAPAEEAAAPTEEAAAPAEEAAAPAEEAAAPAEEEIAIETDSSPQPSSVTPSAEETIDFAAADQAISLEKSQENSVVAEEAPLEISENTENLSETAVASSESEKTETLVENSENTEESPLEVDESSDAKISADTASEEISESPPLEMAGSEDESQSAVATNAEVSESEAVEEPPLEIAGAEATPSAIENESATEEPPGQEANLGEDQASVEEEVMKDEEIPVAEAAPTETPVTTEETAPAEQEAVAAEAAPAEQEAVAEAAPAPEMKELDIVDDTVEAEAPPAESTADGEIKAATPEELAGDSPQPIDHGLGEDTSVHDIAPPQNIEAGGSSELAEEASSIGLDDDVKPTNTVTATNKTSIQVRGKYFMVILSDGSDFRIPFKTIQVGKVLEMQIEDEVFIVENIDGKLQVKYGDFEMHVPLSHGSEGEDTIEGAA